MQHKSGDQVVHGFEIIERTRRGSFVPPEYSSDGDAILMRDGELVEFLDPKKLSVEVLGPISHLAMVDPDATIVLPMVTRSLTRYFDGTSILHKELPEEQRAKAKNVARVAGFRGELSRLLSWLEQPDETVVFERVDDQQLLSEQDINKHASQILLRLPRDEIDRVLQEAVYDGYNFTLENFMKNYFFSPGVEQALRRKQHESLDKTWEWFNRLGIRRRVNLFDNALLQRAPHDFFTRSQIAQVLQDTYFSEPFDAWFDAEIEGYEGARVNNERMTNTNGLLHSRLEAIEEEVQVDVVDSRSVGRRRSSDPEELYDVLLKYRVKRDALRAILNDYDERPMSPGEMQSKSLGELLLVLLFAQENSHMTPEEIRAIKSVEHANPCERTARKIALGMIFAFDNAMRLREIAEERAKLVLDAKNT
jgi:hypothetical protein